MQLWALTKQVLIGKKKTVLESEYKNWKKKKKKTKDKAKIV